MGYWHKVYLKRKEAETTTSTTGTVTLDLPTNDYISQLTIVPYHTNTTLSNDALVPSFYAIKKLEVLNGAEVIKSLSGAQAQALAYYWGRTNPAPHRLDWESTETYDFFYLRFGRYVGDLEFMLNMAELTNPQLKIEYDFSTTSYYGETIDCPTSPTFKWSVLADVYRGEPPTTVLGYFRSQQIFDYTQAASATEYVDIPRTEPIIGIMCQGGYTGKNLLADFDRVRLNINTGELVPCDIYAEELMALQEEWFQPPPEVRGRVQYLGGKKIDLGLGYLVGLQSIVKFGVDRALLITSDTGGFVKYELYDISADAWDTSEDWPIFFHAKGLFPHHSIYLPAHRLTRDGAFTLPAPDYSKILLELTSSSAASTSANPKIVLEQLGS